MAIEWIRKSDERETRSAGALAVHILPNAVSLSASLREALMSTNGKKPGVYVLFGVKGQKLALVKAEPDDRDAWYFNPKTGRTHNKKLLALLAEKGFGQGRYIMEWNKRAKCYLSVEAQAITPRRRRTARASA
ncbi:hypothetical protein [Thermaerobacter subterraneus]|uniref:Uncharacterized protein n=1 Tax=Thermaerobacter subterraneus DSM 13965 TaxID=867903 RepID=K6QBP3_9FIRM|nr:hypothetical protein [Thermaerobacter subterraneus]EKP93806.1 hypothetical protein ThesuDRAFT_00050 [Thermaerobacter subterraneus DSM 13965]